ncbi:MAG: hypothetical protein RLZZ09_2911 [Pseudomonadota bacterium]|jgi:hypothetical protein
MYASRDDLLDILRDVILSEPAGAVGTGQRLAEGLNALARQFPQDLELRALAEDAAWVVNPAK